MSDYPDLIRAYRARIDELEERVRQLEALLVPVMSIPDEWSLTLTEAAIFRALAARERVPRGALMEARSQVVGHMLHAADDPKIMDVHIHKMRRKLKAFGITIDTIWGFGYALRNRQQFASLRAAA